MDQIKTGSFLKELRKEKNLTQESLAELFNISNRTVSRWETGSNMPDIAMLVTLAEFYDVSIPEIINGERKSENMDKEIKETAEKMAEYSHHEEKHIKQKVAGCLLFAFGLFIIISALTIFPSESSWGSIYSIFGSIVLLIGVYLLIRRMIARPGKRALAVIVCAVFLFGVFAVTDYVAVASFHQVPRFRYETTYHSQRPDELVHKTIFFDAVQKNIGTPEETVVIVKRR